MVHRVARTPFISWIAGAMISAFVPNSEGLYSVLFGPGRSLKFLINPSTQTAIWFGTYERDTINFLVSRLSSGMVFWDIGANIGYYSLVLAHCQSNLRTYAFEPLPDNFEILKRNISINDLNVHAECKAISDNTGEGIFLLGSNNSMGKLTGKEDSSDQGNCFRVAISTVDELIDGGLEPPDVIKVDAEGEEGKIVLGATKVLETYGPSLLIEIHDIENATLCWEELEKYGYKVYVLDGGGMEQASGPEQINSSHVWCEC